MENASLFPVVHYWAHLQGMEEHLSLVGIILVGFFIGVLSGFFGIGGRFLLAPFLNILFNVPYNVTVGSEICQMLGNSSMSLTRSRSIDNVDYKLAFYLIIAAVAGVEGGTQLLEILKGSYQITFLGQSLSLLVLAFTVFYSCLLLWMGTTIYREARTSYGGGAMSRPAAPVGSEVTTRLQAVYLKPMISLPGSGIGSISLWVVLGVGFFVGLLVGCLGVGGSFVGLPALVYVLGCPMPIAINTDIFASLFVMSYGTYSHSVKGNIDLAMAIVLLVCTVVGTQIGIPLARRFGGSRARCAFAFLAYLGVFLLIIKMAGLIMTANIPR